MFMPGSVYQRLWASMYCSLNGCTAFILFHYMLAASASYSNHHKYDNRANRL